MLKSDNCYTIMQKTEYANGTSNHDEHNSNPDYWDILLAPLKDTERWTGKYALDFACGKGRNVSNMLSLCKWDFVDGVDISYSNVDYCRKQYKDQESRWYCNNGIDLRDIKDNVYDFVMSTIALQHIPVHDIRKSLMKEIYRVMDTGGMFSFQMGYGEDLHIPIGGSRSTYFQNTYDANGTNSTHDVRVQNVADLEKDLSEIGFKNTTFQIRDSFSDSGHPQWVYVQCEK